MAGFKIFGGRNPLAAQLQLQPNQNRSIFVQQLMARALQNNGRGSRSLAESADIASAPIVAALLDKRDQQTQLQQQAQQKQIANQMLGQSLRKNIELENLDGQPSDTFSVPSMGPTDPTRQALASALAQNPQAMTALAMQQATPKPTPTLTPYEREEVRQGDARIAADAKAAESLAAYRKDEVANQQTANKIAQQRADQEGLPKPPQPPSGYQYGPDGKLSFIPGGPADPANRPLNEVANKNAELVQSLGSANELIKGYEKAGMTDTSSVKDAALDSNPVTRLMTSQEYRQYQAAGLQWAANLLYLKSGATANPSEITNTWKQYFPQPGDSKETKQKKAAMREDEFNNASNKFLGGKQSGGATGGWTITEVK